MWIVNNGIALSEGDLALRRTAAVFVALRDRVLSQNPALAMGFPLEFFLVGAAFVELGLGYLLIIGLLIGSVLFIGAFAYANIAKRLNKVWFNLGNLLGAIFLLISLSVTFNLGPAFLSFFRIQPATRVRGADCIRGQTEFEVAHC